MQKAIIGKKDRHDADLRRKGNVIPVTVIEGRSLHRRQKDR